MKASAHLHRTVLVCFAAAGSIFIVLYRRWHQLGEAIVSPSFYFAVLVSFCIGLFLLWLVQIGSKFLDKRCSWHRNRYLRLFYQIILCIAVPAAIDVLLIALYLKAIGKTDHFDDFLEIDFPVVVAMLAIFNLFYVTTLPQRTPARIGDGQISNEDNHPPAHSDTLVVSHGSVNVHLRINEDVLCLLKEGRYIAVLTVSGDEYRIHDTMCSLQDRFLHTPLHRINRSAFINARYMIGYRSGDTPRTLEILIDPKYRKLLSPHRKHFLAVTGEHIPVIRHLFREQD